MNVSVTRIAVNKPLAFMNAFGSCQNKCRDANNLCAICTTPYKYHLRALQQPYASVVLAPPKMYEFFFDARKVKKPSIYVPYFMVIIGYSSAIDTMRFQLSADSDLPTVSQHLRDRKVLVLPKFLERLKQFAEEADKAYLIEDAESGRLALIQTMEMMIAFGLACFAEVNQKPDEEDMFNKTKLRCEKSISNKLQTVRQEMVSNETFNESWKAYKIGQMYQKEKEAGMDVDN